MSATARHEVFACVRGRQGETERQTYTKREKERQRQREGEKDEERQTEQRQSWEDSRRQFTKLLQANFYLCSVNVLDFLISEKIRDTVIIAISNRLNLNAFKTQFI